MEKSTLFCCFTCIVFIELNLSVAFLLKRKTWDDPFAGKVGDGRSQEMGGILVMGRWFWNGRWYPFTDYAPCSSGAKIWTCNCRLGSLSDLENAEFVTVIAHSFDLILTDLHVITWFRMLTFSSSGTINIQFHTNTPLSFNAI